MRITELRTRAGPLQLTGKSAVILLPVLLQDVLQEVLVGVLPFPDLLHVDHAPGYMEDPVPRKELEHSGILPHTELTGVSFLSGFHHRGSCRPQ